MEEAVADMTPEELRTTAANIEKFIAKLDKDLYRYSTFYGLSLANHMRGVADRLEKADKMIELVRNS